MRTDSIHFPARSLPGMLENEHAAGIKYPERVDKVVARKKYIPILTQEAIRGGFGDEDSHILAGSYCIFIGCGKKEHLSRRAVPARFTFGFDIITL